MAHCRQYFSVREGHGSEVAGVTGQGQQRKLAGTAAICKGLRLAQLFLSAAPAFLADVMKPLFLDLKAHFDGIKSSYLAVFTPTDRRFRALLLKF